MKIYIASCLTNARNVKALATKLMTMGDIECFQTWPDTHDTDEELCALRDLHQIERADLVLVYTEGCELVSGGMHFEAGYAYAAGIPVAVVGPLVHVFYHLQDIEKYSSLADFLTRTELLNRGQNSGV